MTTDVNAKRAPRGMSAFEYYLRTGRQYRRVSNAVEVKFNPYHDPQNGRFTFRRITAGITLLASLAD